LFFLSAVILLVLPLLPWLVSWIESWRVPLLIGVNVLLLLPLLLTLVFPSFALHMSMLLSYWVFAPFWR
jgi:hypothetical protein